MVPALNLYAKARKLMMGFERNPFIILTLLNQLQI